jgi:hypothetical protein
MRPEEVSLSSAHRGSAANVSSCRRKWINPDAVRFPMSDGHRVLVYFFSFLSDPENLIRL